jgi:hypothetical protein
MTVTTAKKPLLDVGRVIQNAVVFNLRNGSRARMNSDNLPQTVSNLFNLFHSRKIDYVLVGGIAMLLYVEGRNTEDIDLIVAVPSLKQMPEIKVTDQNEFFARGKFDDLQVDLLLTRNKLFEKVRKSHSTQQKIVDQTVRCATVEGLLLLKLYALPPLYRQSDFARVGIYENDVATLIQQYSPKTESLFKELEKHLSKSDLDSVREIVGEIQQRIERFNKRH